MGNKESYGQKTHAASRVIEFQEAAEALACFDRAGSTEPEMYASIRFQFIEEN